MVGAETAPALWWSEWNQPRNASTSDPEDSDLSLGDLLDFCILDEPRAGFSKIKDKLPVAMHYKHLGGVLDEDGKMGLEASRRIGERGARTITCAKRVFSHKVVPRKAANWHII